MKKWQIVTEEINYLFNEDILYVTDYISTWMDYRY